jgi:DUF4097 and DUF4098 domain-containing protein YvlB
LPSSRRPLAALAALVLALASLAACGAEGPFTVDASARQTLDKAIAPGTPDLRVRVEMFNGSIEVRAGAADRVVATVETTGVGATQADAEADRAKIRVSLDVNPDGSVLLRAVYQPSPDSPENRSARAFVEVPPGAALDLRTSNGAVTAAGIRGAVDVRTSNGSVTLAGLRSGAIVRTSNGTVDLAGGGLLDVESSNAKVAIRGTSATVRVHTSNGDVSFEGTFSSGAQDLETSNGPVTVRLSPDSSFRLDAATSNGTVTVDGFAITTTDPVDADALHGTVGTGGPSIILRTSNASIVVSAVIVERP